MPFTPPSGPAEPLEPPFQTLVAAEVARLEAELDRPKPTLWDMLIEGEADG